MSLKDRIEEIQKDSVKWRHRVQSYVDPPDVIPKVAEIRKSLDVSQQKWKDRVPEKDASKFTVDERIRQSGAPRLDRSFTIHTCGSTRENPTRYSISKLQDAANRSSCKLPAEPIVRATSKENHPAPQVRQTTQELAGPSIKHDVVKQTVTVRPIGDETLTSFFTSPTPLLESNESDSYSLPDRKMTPLPSNCHTVAQARRTVRPERRKPQTHRSLVRDNDNQPMQYEEIRPSSALSTTAITPFQRLMNPVCPSTRICKENMERRSHLAEAALAGLGSTENFAEVKTSLRPQTEQLPLSQTQRQLLPYKPLMLLQVKGRRHVQVRLVSPSADSLNSGDCFVLVSGVAVFAWLGTFANVVETNKARELAEWIHKHHELSFRGSAGDNNANPIFVQERRLNAVDAGVEAQQFWKALGYDEPQQVHACGIAEEDELYEMLIQQTNRVYEVTRDQLVPCQTYWGCPLRHSLLTSDKAFVFDFGSEVYLWTGAQLNPEIRLAGMELVQQAFAAPYDYTSCGLNPLDPLSTHSTISASAPSRPVWSLVGRVTEKGETVLFKEKFVDWPQSAPIGILPSAKSVARQNRESMTSAYSAIQPYSADELYQAAFNDPAPDPILLTLDGRFVGRGNGEGCRHEDGIPRRYRVESNPIHVWHVSEFSRIEVPQISHGQFYTGDTYVVRWPFRVLHVGMREIPTRTSDVTPAEQCAYFFWQGLQSNIAEKGAAALLTVELDEERGPQIRVSEGNEPPAFCRLFDGRMVIHSGKRTAPAETERGVRMFLVRGEIPAEGHLREVPPRLSSLRPQGSFLILQYGSNSSIQKAWLWFGRQAPEGTVSTAKHVVDRLRSDIPPELGTEFKNVVEVHQTEDKVGPGEMVFLLNAENCAAEMLCLDVDRGRSALTIWHVSLADGRQLQTKRLVYALQPDSTVTAMLSPRLPRNTDETNAVDMAKAVAERLRACSAAIAAPTPKNSENYLSFPFLLSELYDVTQPALFLVSVGTQCVYVWQGWWPLASRSRLTRRLTRNSQSQSTMDGSSEAENGSDFGSTTSLDDESAEASTMTGSSLVRFSVLRRAVLQTALDLATKIGCKAFVVYAGLEPPEFLSLFPPFERPPDAAMYHQREEGKVDGQMDSIESLLISSRSTSYTLTELQKRPLPVELDATNLEVYLSDEAFQTAFGMTRSDFDMLPLWKKVSRKKRLGLF